MTQQQQPLTPPEYLHDRWTILLKGWIATGSTPRFDDLIALLNEAFRTGADQELEACCEWLDVPNNRSDRGDGWLMPGRLRAARRPKPKSQAEEAIAELDGIVTCFLAGFGGDRKCCNIRAALERLRELEKQADE